MSKNRDKEYYNAGYVSWSDRLNCSGGNNWITPLMYVTIFIIASPFLVPYLLFMKLKKIILGDKS